MKRFLTLILIVTCVMVTYAKFTIHSVSGSVKLERAGQVQKLVKGTEVRGVDKIIVGNNSSVEIHNSADTRVYRCTRPGQYTPTAIMMNARKEANSKVGTIANAVRFGSGNKQQGPTIYEEACMVTRALETYDPEGAAFRIDATQLAKALAGKILLAPGDSIFSDSIPTHFEHSIAPTGKGLEFRVDNILDFPVYLNVVKYKSGSNTPEIAISELGQPVGCYILLPGQSLMRSHSRELDPEYRHLIVMTHCYFDIDEVIEKTAAVELEPGVPALELPEVTIAEI